MLPVTADIKLLAIFDELLTVGRAGTVARKFGMTTPAVSQALVRLRQTFGDPLFVRSKTGLQPTPYALELAPSVRDVLRIWGTISQASGTFDPHGARGTVVVACPDALPMNALVSWVEHLTQVAPELTVDLRGVSTVDIEARDLRNGDVDLVLGFNSFAGRIPGVMEEASAQASSCALVVSRRHRHITDACSVEQYLRARHLLLVPTGDGRASENLVEHWMRNQGILPTNILRTNSVALFARTLAESDMVGTVPAIVAQTLGDGHPVRSLQPPLPIPAVQLRMCWHERTQGSPLHNWLREQVRLHVLAAFSTALQANGTPSTLRIEPVRFQRTPVPA